MRYRALEIDSLILAAQKPSRYVGGEVNSVVKELPAARVTWVLCFPDTYEVGMSNVGLRVLYHVLNQHPDVACERAFMPWPDMAALQRERHVPLWSMESRVPLRDFDILGFSLQFEACYTTCLAMLDLAGIPLFAAERSEKDPLILAGGPCTYNGEPMAPFFDAMVIGDGEEVVGEISDAVAEWKAAKGTRRELLEKLARIAGVYVPSLFRVEYGEGAAIASIEPLLPGVERVTRRVVADLRSAPQPERPVLPFMQAVHDRLPLEIQRGCTRGCRFCQAGMVTRPVRQRDPQGLVDLAARALSATGWEEVGFLSLSAGDYGCLNAMLESFLGRFAASKVAISLPSLRTETMSEELARQIARVKKTGFTIAPEAGSDRLRRVINKGNSEESLLEGVQSVFRSGWSLLKLYFMIGLPTERDEDLTAIAELARKAHRMARAIRPEARVNLSVSTFVPKPFTPFQWDPMIGLDEIVRRHDLLRAAIPRKGSLVYKYHEAKGSLVEGALARGDRRMATAVAAAYRLGQLLDGWTEHFDYARWAEAFRAMEREHGISAEQVAHRERAETEILPWDHLSAGVEKSFLLAERARSRSEVVLENCASGRCSACGACDFDRIVNRIFPPGSMQPEPAIEVSEPAALERALVRIRYSKTGRAVAVSHLESMTLLHRALRRSGLPIAFTQGFNPRPRVSLGPACPVGIESMAEYFDVELTRALEPRVIAGALDSQMPTGFRIMEVEAIDPSTPSLSASIEWIAYRARLGSDANEEMTRAVERFQSAGTVQVIRRKKGRDGAPQPAGPPQRIIDLKKVVLDLTLEGPREVRFRLRARNEASAKPAEVLEALFGRDRDPRVIKDSVQFAPSGRLQGGR